MRLKIYKNWKFSKDSQVFYSALEVRNMERKLKNFFPKFTKNKIFEIDYKVLSVIGFTPERMLNLRSFFIFFLSLVIEVFPELYFIMHHSNDVKAVFMCLHEFVSLLVHVLKVFVFFFNRQTLVELIEDLKESWRKCEFNREKFNRKQFFFPEAFTEGSEEWNRVGLDLEKLIFKTTRNFYMFVFCSALFYFTVPIIVYFSVFGGTESSQWPLPVQV